MQGNHTDQEFGGDKRNQDGESTLPDGREEADLDCQQEVQLLIQVYGELSL